MKLLNLKTLIAAVALLTVSTLHQARADEILAYWSQNNNDLPGGGFGFLADPDSFPQAADFGVGNATITFGGGILNETITNSNGDLVYRWIPSFGGTTTNAQPEVPAGGSIGVQGGTLVDGVAPNNGAYLQFNFNMSGYQDLNISYATQRTSTGFTSQTWSWSTDGVSFTDFQNVSSIPSSFGLVAAETLNALDNAPTAFLRVTFNGATATAGNNRLDNILFTATAIPEPGSLALLTLVGLTGLAIRRRSAC